MKNLNTPLAIVIASIILSIAFLTFMFPVFSQIIWVISSIKATGQWINSYTSYVWLYLILCVILWIIIVIFGATAVASSKDD